MKRSALKNPSRRRLFRMGAGLAALSGSVLATARLPTPTQSVGPFFPVRDQPDKDADMTRVMGRNRQAHGEVHRIAGRVLDSAGEPVGGALIDVWQANHHGRYAHERDPNPAPLDPDFQGWAQLLTDDDGRFQILTIKPGAYPASGQWWRPPHIHFKVARRGYRELTTQMYFEGEELNKDDLILNQLSKAEQQAVIVNFTARPDKAVLAGEFEIVLSVVGI